MSALVTAFAMAGIVGLDGPSNAVNTPVANELPQAGETLTIIVAALEIAPELSLIV